MTRRNNALLTAEGDCPGTVSLLNKELSMTQPKKFLRFNDVSTLVGLGRTTIYKGIKAGTFPAPIRIGENAVAWDSTEIEHWQAACIAASRPQLGLNNSTR